MADRHFSFGVVVVLHLSILWVACQTNAAVPFVSGRADFTAMTLSADGRTLATGGDDGVVTLWDAATGRTLRACIGPRTAVTAVAVTADAGRLLAGYDGGQLLLWDATACKVLRELPDRKAGLVSVSLSSDGRWATTAAKSAGVVVWDVDAGQPVNKLDVGATTILSAAISADGRRAIAGCEDGRAIVWDAQLGKKLHTLTMQDSVLSVSLSADGSIAATADDYEAASVWDTTTGQRLSTLKSEDFVTCVALSADGRRVAAGTDLIGTAIRNIIVCDARSGQQINVMPWDNDRITFVAISAKGDRAMTGHAESASVLDVDAGKELCDVWPAFLLTPTEAAVSRDGKQLVIGHEDGTIVLWGLTEGERRVLEGHTGRIHALAIVHDGSVIASGSRDGSAILWDLATGKKLHTCAHGEAVNSVAFSPDGRQLVTGCDDGVARIWDVATGALQQKLVGHGGRITLASFFDGGKRVVTSVPLRSTMIWDTGGKRLETRPWDCRAVTPDGERVIIFDSNTADLALCETASGKTLQVLLAPGKPVNPTKKELEAMDFQALAALAAAAAKRFKWPVTFSTDGTRLVTHSGGYASPQITLWNAQAGEALQAFIGHRNNITGAACADAGQRLWTTAGDHSTRLWSIATGRQICSIHTFKTPGDWLVVSSDGRFDGSPDGIKRVLGPGSDKEGRADNDTHEKRLHQPGLLRALFTGNAPG
jgi:WD40 repeat protein